MNTKTNVYLKVNPGQVLYKKVKHVVVVHLVGKLCHLVCLRLLSLSSIQDHLDGSQILGDLLAGLYITTILVG